MAIISMSPSGTVVDSREILIWAIEIVKSQDCGGQPEFALQRTVKALVGIVESDLLRDEEACRKLRESGFVLTAK